MKLREKLKRFWTLDVHNHEGFTLVELIIVIAILAILSSVAVVGYSSYIKKANIQADKTLVAEISNALTLYAYSNSDAKVTGFIVIMPEGKGDAVANNAAMDAAMVAAYGEDWEKTLSLKHNGWIANSASIVALLQAEQAETIKNSAYMNTTTEALLKNVQEMTLAACNFFDGTSVNKYALLNSQLGGKLEDLCTQYGIETVTNAAGETDFAAGVTDEELANLLVFGVAAMVGDPDYSSKSENDKTIFALLTEKYAEYAGYAYANPNDKTVQDAYVQMNTALQSAKSPTDISNAYTAFETACGAGWTNYKSSGASKSDANAFAGIMQAVDQVSQSGVLGDANLGDANYFTNSNIGAEFDNYVEAVEMVGNLTDSDWAILESAIENGSVIIFLYSGPMVDCSSNELSE